MSIRDSRKFNVYRYIHYESKTLRISIDAEQNVVVYC